MILGAAAVLAALISVLLVGVLVVLIGDAVEARRHPLRGFPTCRRMQDDLLHALSSVRRRVRSRTRP